MAYVVRSFKLTILAALMAVAHGGIFETQAVGVAPAVTRIAPIAYATTVAKAIVGPPVVAAPAVAKTVAVDTNFDPNPQYTFSYDIRDALTGDNKAQIESRNGDVVQGQYSLLEPDGTRRTVEYTSDPINGFNAVVHHNTAAVVTKVTTPVAVTSPVVTNVASPVAITAPVITKVATPVAVASPAIAAFPAAPVVKAFATPVAYATPIAKSFATPVEFATPAIGKALIH